MKTTFILISLIFILGSCLDKDDRVPEDEGSGCNQVSLRFINGKGPVYKSMGDSIASPAELAVLSAKIFIFQPSGAKLFEKTLTLSEVTDIGTNPIKFTVPGMIASTTYDYYVVFNHDDIDVTSLDELKTLPAEKDIASYNGSWPEVNDNASNPKRTGGFVMEGNTSQQATTDLTQTQSISVIIERIVAKLDITTTIDPTQIGPSGKYQGTIAIDSAQIVNTQNSTPLIPGTPTTEMGTLTLASQSSNTATLNSKYENRFYVFENGTMSAGSRVQIKLYGRYIENGQTLPVTYITDLTTNGTGAIIRNGSYDIKLNIKGLTGTPLEVSITISNWNSVIQQISDIGS